MQELIQFQTVLLIYESFERSGDFFFKSLICTKFCLSQLQGNKKTTVRR